MKTTYEWDVETLDAHGDIIDHHHCDTLSCYTSGSYRELMGLVHAKKAELVLVRDVHASDDKLLDRSWAYVKIDEGRLSLPEAFENGKQVPERFHAELDAKLSGWPQG